MKLSLIPTVESKQKWGRARGGMFVCATITSQASCRMTAIVQR